MLTHIPIPERDSYGVALALIYGLGALPLAALCHARLLADRFGFPATYLCVLALVNAWGFVVVGEVALFPHGGGAAGAAVLAGAAAGWAARQSDRMIVRRVLRGSMKVTPRQRGGAGLQANITLAGQGRTRRTLAPQRLAEGWEDWRLSVGSATPGLFGLAAGGALEELSYRGFIVAICLQAPSLLLSAAALIATTAVFAVSHIWFGWAHVAGKAALGLIALGLVLSFQAVLPAVVAHVVFNALAWRDLPGQGAGRRLVR
jgi:hypothetical protein